MKRHSHGLAFAGAVLLAACSIDDEIRGSDDDAFVGAARVRVATRDDDSLTPPADGARRVRYRPTIEIGTDYVDGEFAHAAGSADYDVWRMHAAFAPELSLRDLCITPLVGFGFGEADASAGNLRGGGDLPGAFFGAEASLRSLRWLQPYARYSAIAGPDLALEQVEAGVDVRATDEVGVLVGYAWKSSEIGDLTELRGVDIDSRGVFVGLSLRF